ERANRPVSDGWPACPYTLASDVGRLPVSLMYGAGRDGDGLMAESGATSARPIGSATLAVTLGGSWANRSYRQSFYGVSAADAAASGLPAPNIGPGWQGGKHSLWLARPTH